MTTYHDWATQSTPALQYERLCLYITEISAQLGSPDVSADGKAIDKTNLMSLYKTLLDERKRYESAGIGSAAGCVILSKRR